MRKFKVQLLVTVDCEYMRMPDEKTLIDDAKGTVGQIIVRGVSSDCGSYSAQISGVEKHLISWGSDDVELS